MKGNETDLDLENPKRNSTQTEEKLKYPKSVFFIFSNEFCERFSYYGMRTILSIYLQSELGYTENASTVLYHTFVMLCYFTPLIGAVIADSWLGKYKTIFYVSLIYALGNIILSIGSLGYTFIPRTELSLLGLFLIAVGTGGIKPCVSSFGGDQFVLPQQEKQLEKFFSVFYFSINVGSLLSSFLTPMLREIRCLGQDTCYPLAFGIPAILMVLSVIFFVAGKRMYVMKEPEGKNIAVSVAKCSAHAIMNKARSKKDEKRNHWLDHADDKYSVKLIQDTKILMKIIVLFSPTVIFWSLYEQQGSRWTFQASHMDGRVGDWIIQPDQMQTLNSILCLLFIPMFQSAVYPCLYKLRLVRSSLQKLCWGGFIAALAFVLSGVVQMYMQPSYPVLPKSGEAQLRIFNGVDCSLELSSPDLELGPLPPLGYIQKLNIPVHNSANIDVHIDSKCIASLNSTITVNNMKASSYMITMENKNLQLIPLQLNEYNELDKLSTGNPKLKIIYSISSPTTLEFSTASEIHVYDLDPSSHQTTWNLTTTTGKYKVKINDMECAEKANLQPGGVYTVMLNPDGQNFTLFTITPPNNISMLWQMPQYFVITAAEIMFSITGMEFSFTQSPESMKSVMSSIWFITDALGNLIDLLIAEMRIFDNQAYEFFLFAGLMAFVMFIFVAMAYHYKYVKFDENGDVIPDDEDAAADKPSQRQSYD